MLFKKKSLFSIILIISIFIIYKYKIIYLISYLIIYKLSSRFIY